MGSMKDRTEQKRGTSENFLFIFELRQQCYFDVALRLEFSGSQNFELELHHHLPLVSSLPIVDTMTSSISITAWENSPWSTNIYMCLWGVSLKNHIHIFMSLRDESYFTSSIKLEIEWRKTVFANTTMALGNIL